MKRYTVDLIAAARPNFMKVAPLYHALKAEDWCRVRLIHTGQHYDPNMSQAFFDDLGLPDPDKHLGVGSGTHAEQTAGVMVAYEKVCLEEPPDWIVVVGDVNSTMACALVGKKLHLNVAHLEAGLRSFDRTMPEEINRIVTDCISDLLWTPSEDGNDNLQAEGIPQQRIEMIGNVMIDSFEAQRPLIEALHARRDFNLEGQDYAVVTLHRPSNVDDQTTLQVIVEQLITLASHLALVFPVHPRTENRLKECTLYDALAREPNIRLINPVGYRAFMNIVLGCQMVITDSGGIQEETSYMGIRCLTVRENTERPVTLTLGTNELVRPDQIASSAVVEKLTAPANIPGWDGKAALRARASLKNRCLGTDSSK